MCPAPCPQQVLVDPTKRLKFLLPTEVVSQWAGGGVNLSFMTLTSNRVPSFLPSAWQYRPLMRRFLGCPTVCKVC